MCFETFVLMRNSFPAVTHIKFSIGTCMFFPHYKGHVHKLFSAYDAKFGLCHLQHASLLYASQSRTCLSLALPGHLSAQLHATVQTQPGTLAGLPAGVPRPLSSSAVAAELLTANTFACSAGIRLLSNLLGKKTNRIALQKNRG